jgi:hypothetical protein
MSPGKLFDYLEGKLPPGERTDLEARLLEDAGLRRELAVAREIHRQNARSPDQFPDPANRGPVLARRIAIAFAILVFANVAFGIYAIAFMEKKRRAQMTDAEKRNDITQTLSQTAAAAMPTPTLEIEEITLNANPAEEQAIAEKVLRAAKQAGGSAAKGLTDEHGTLIFAEIPTARLSAFRDSLKKIGASIPITAPQSSGEKTILQVRIVRKQ